MTIRPKLFVNYTKYTLFISHLVHEKKRMGIDAFIEKYKNKRYGGICDKYLKGYIEYLKNQRDGKIIKCEKYSSILVVDKDIYDFYYKYKDKAVFKRELKNAIPEFLEYGLLVTEVQETIDNHA